MIKPAQWAFDKTKVDPSWNWFWSGSTICWPMWENTGSFVADIGTIGAHAIFATESFAPSWNTDANGVTIYFARSGSSNTGSFIELVTPTGFGTLMETGSYTMYAVIRPDNVCPIPEASQTIIGDYNNLLVSESIMIKESYDKRYCMAFSSCGEGQLGDILTPDDNGQLKVMVMTWDGDTRMFSARTNDIHIGQSPEIFVPYSYKMGCELVIGRSGMVDGHYFNGDIAMIGVHKGVVWTDQQVTDFTANPFGPITSIE